MTEPRRDRWGRYIIPDPETGEDREWTRATTIAGVLPDRWNLEKWGERMVALGIAKQPELYALAKASKPEDKQRLDKLCRDAKAAAGAGSAATFGNALHSFTEALDNGEEVDPPYPYNLDIDAYRAGMKKHRLKVLSSEQIVINPEIGIAGTYDRLLEVPGREDPVIGDIKTGKSVDFSHLEHAVQLAIYANATHRFNVETGEVEPVGPVDREVGLILHLPVGKAKLEIYELDLVEGWAAAKLAHQVYHLRKRKDLSKPYGVGA